ncbi:hypothetical protein EV126DRAFT_202493 [Verticillium dahliae]|nr:hypothetical protein EV126DRAFT_202493 [Verticillium dahliae]
MRARRWLVRSMRAPEWLLSSWELEAIVGGSWGGSSRWRPRMGNADARCGGRCGRGWSTTADGPWMTGRMWEASLPVSTYMVGWRRKRSARVE